MPNDIYFEYAKPSPIEELEAEHTFEPEELAEDYYAACGCGFDA
jgi:hypothetical protein